jgi:hypothetical protein
VTVGKQITLIAPPSVIRHESKPLVPLVPSIPEGLRPYDQPVLPAPDPPPLPNEGAPPATDPEGFEARSVVYSWPWSADLSGGLGPVVYTTRRRWHACDVYVSVNSRAGGPPFEKGVLSILIFAVSQSGARTLVASGRVQDDPGELTSAAPLWIAAARSSAQRWEVVLAMYQGPGAASSDVDLTVTVVASEDTTRPPDLLGAIPVGTGGATSTGQSVSASVVMGAPALGMAIPYPELCGLVWVNGAAAAARYLMYFEGVTPANGLTPLITWPLGAAAGDGIFDWNVRRRTRAHIAGKPGFPPGYLGLRPSTTPHTLTIPAPDDCWGQTFVR